MPDALLLIALWFLLSTAQALLDRKIRRLEAEIDRLRQEVLRKY
mgnify:FL=1|jgi:hypothetical protein